MLRLGTERHQAGPEPSVSPEDPSAYHGVQLNPDGTPNRADITRSAQAAVLLRIRLQAE